MSKKQLGTVEVLCEKIVGGGQALGTMEDGRKLFIWGGLPGEKVRVQLTKKKSSYGEGFVTEVLSPSPERIEPRDKSSFLSTSPWQIMAFEAEQRYKAQLIDEAFELHHIALENPTVVFTDGKEFGYRNKVEFSFWWDTDKEELSLAFFKRGTRGKVPVVTTSLAALSITSAAQRLLGVLKSRGDEAYVLKTALIRTSRTGQVVVQLYVKSTDYAPFTETELTTLDTQGFELIYSEPKSPASVITKRLQRHGNTILTDTILNVPFTYAAESFFQVNLPVYEQALLDIREWVEPESATVELYSGVGSIGLTVTKDNLTMVEINEAAVREAERTIASLGREGATKAVYAPSEKALEYITPEPIVIVDPPRAGLHNDVIDTLLENKPPRIIYLSCNPVTQARDVSRLIEVYDIRFCQGYNFFPRTPHIEHLIVLDAK